MDQPEGDTMATATEDLTEQQQKEAERAATDAQAAAEAVENHAALERAVADLPEVPGRDEFLTLCQLARVYSQSGIVPKALKGKPHDVLVVLMTGRDLGIPLTAALRKVYVIEGQPSLAPQLKLSLIRKKGLGNVIPHPDNGKLWDRQGAIALGPDGEVITDSEGNVIGWTGALAQPYWFTWAEDAVIGGYVREGCTPTHHTDECNKARANSNVPQHNGRTANFCKDNYRKNPRRMLWQRASGFVADDHFSEATLGLYDPDELGGMLDDEGHLIDVNHVEVPAGFGPSGGGQQGGASGGTPSGDELVDLAEAWAIQLRVFSLPEDAQAEFRQRWVQGKVAGSLADDPEHDPPRRRFPAVKLNLVNAMLLGVEKQWEKQGKYNPEVGPAAFMENVLAPAMLRLLPLPFGWLTRGPADPPPTAAPDGPAGPEPEGAADSAPEPSSAGDAAEGQAEGQPDGALPLALPGGPPPELLTIPDAVRSGTDDEQVAWLVDFLKATRVADVDTLLRYYEASTSGVPSERRQRLGALIAEHELGKEPPAGTAR